MKPVMLYFFIFISFLFWGCSSTGMVIVNPEYQGKTLSDRTIHILPIPLDAISIKNVDDVADDFEDDTRPADVLLQDSLYRALWEICKSRIQNISLTEPSLPFSFFSSQTNRDKFDIYTKTLGKESIEKYYFFVPRKSMLADTGLIPDLSLILNNVSFSRNTTTSSMPGVFTPGQTISTPGGTFTTPGHMSGGGMSTSEDLGTVVHFIIWDYQKNCEVAYGALNVKTAFAFGMTRSTWRKAFSNIATEIFKETPFKFKDLKTRW